MALLHLRHLVETLAIILKVLKVLKVLKNRPQNCLKTGSKRPFLDTKSATKRARWLEMAQNLFVVMCICSPVILSYLDVNFES